MPGHRATERPITPDAVERNPQRDTGLFSVSELLERWHELDGRHHRAHALATLKARGQYDPAKHGGPAGSLPLTVGEHLTVIALGEAISRVVRHPAQVHHAVAAGATWQQIADATGQPEQRARQAYREWADGQRRLHEAYGGTFGMDPSEHAAAIHRADTPSIPAEGAER